MDFLDFLKLFLFGWEDPYLQKALLGAILSLAGSAIGGIIGASASKKAAKKQQAALDDRKRAEANWYDRRYNEDYTQTATAQSLLNCAQQYAEDTYRRAAGAAKVGGASTESAALAKQAGNRMIADITGNIAAQGDARRDSIDRQHQQNLNSFTDTQMQIYGQRAATSSAAASSLMNAGMGLIGADISSYLNSGIGLFNGLFKKNGGAA